MSQSNAHLPSSELQESWTDFFSGLFFRAAPHIGIPARWFESNLPEPRDLPAKIGQLQIEVVTHCWNYSHLLKYQLSSLVNFPPLRANITVTVFYSKEDQETCALLDCFAEISVPNISWNWIELPKHSLFRRAIGRNFAALNTKADWVWFTDCDLLFRNQCIDKLAEALQERRDFLIYPREEYCTELLAENDSALNRDQDDSPLIDIDETRFESFVPDCATGPLQIAHGDVVRACGYCNALPYYQKPSSRWCKAYEDKAFRWLLGTEGVPVEIPGVYRIRHREKGRYKGRASYVRSRIRRLQSWLKSRSA